MTTLKHLCQKYFDTNDIYEVLGVGHASSEKEIKKAYHKLSLLVHPDRVDESRKAVATEKFKILSKIHSILQDPDKRKFYDDCGRIDDENDSDFDWMTYWSVVFKEIEVKDIEEYERKYIGSETELDDIKKAYLKTEGNMDRMLDLIPFSNCDSEPRIQEIIRKMVDDGEVEEYPGFFNESKLKKTKRKKKFEKEKKMANKVDTKAVEKEVKLNREKRLKGFADLISNIEAKYGGATKRKSIKNVGKT